MRSRFLLAGALAAPCAALLLWACGGTTGSADRTPSGGVADAPAPDAARAVEAAAEPLALPFDVAEVETLRYEEGVYMLGTSTFLAFDLASGTGTKRLRDPDAGDAGDAGPTTFTISAADVAVLREKLAAAPVSALEPACSGHDGPYKWLFVEGPRPAPIVLSDEYACSGGPVVNVVVDLGDLRGELYRIAGEPLPSGF